MYKSISYYGKRETLLVNQAVICLHTFGCVSLIICESMRLERHVVYMLQYNPAPLITYEGEYEKRQIDLPG